MTNILSAAELKRRGMAAIEEGLRRGPVHLVKHNKPAAVVLSAADYQRLTADSPKSSPGMTAVQWLLSQKTVDGRSKADIDAALARERTW